MAIQVGEKIPSCTVKTAKADGSFEDQSTDALFGGKKVVLFSVPGAFTPTCSQKHLPGFVEKAQALLDKGAGAILCLSVNDPFVMAAWAKDQGVGDEITMVADGSGELTRALGLDFDASNFAMGVRGQRFALIADDGVVTHLNVEQPMKFEVSDADTMLGLL